MSRIAHLFAMKAGRGTRPQDVALTSANRWLTSMPRGSVAAKDVTDAIEKLCRPPRFRQKGSVPRPDWRHLGKAGHVDHVQCRSQRLRSFGQFPSVHRAWHADIGEQDREAPVLRNALERFLSSGSGRHSIAGAREDIAGEGKEIFVVVCDENASTLCAAYAFAHVLPFPFPIS